MAFVFYPILWLIGPTFPSFPQRIYGIDPVSRSMPKKL